MAKLDNTLAHILCGAIALSAASCGDQSLLERDIELRTHQSSGWKVPLATADARIADILSGNMVANDALIERNDSMILRLDLPDLVRIHAVDDLIPTADLSAVAEGKLPETGYPLTTTIPAGALSVISGLYPASEGRLDLDLTSDVEEISDLSFSLDLGLDITNSPVGAEVKFVFPTVLTEGGTAYEVRAQVSAGQRSSLRVSTGTVRISPQSLGHVLSLPYRITVTPVATQSPIRVTQGDGIKYKLSASNLSINKFSGRIKPIVQELAQQAVNWDFDIWEDLTGLKLNDGRLTFSVSASHLVGQATFDPVISFLGADAQVINTWRGPQKSLDINAETAAAQTVVEYRSDDLQNLLSLIQGNGIVPSAQVRFGGRVYLDRQATLDVDLAVEQPIVIGLSGLKVEIPMDAPTFNQLDEVRDTFTQIGLVLRSTSTVPLALECHEVRLLDAEGKPISGDASLPLSGKIIGGDNPSGEISLMLSPQHISQLKRAKRVVVVATVSTPSADPVLLRASQRVQLQLSTVLNVNLK